MKSLKMHQKMLIGHFEEKLRCEITSDVPDKVFLNSVSEVVYLMMSFEEEGKLKSVMENIEKNVNKNRGGKDDIHNQ